MRRLDELLTAATGRGEWTGPDALIQHLERRLAGEREQVVAAPRRNVMVATETRPTTPTEHPPRRNRWAYALAAFAVIAASVAAAMALLGNGDEEQATDELTQERAIQLVQDFAADVRSNDTAAIIADSATGVADTGMVEWMYGLEANPQFTNCRVTRQTTNGVTVLCDVAFAADSFLARAAAGTTTAAIDVFSNELMGVTGWPPPAGLGDSGLELRAFFDARHPELVDTVFGPGYAGMAWTEEAGRAITLHLDEFIEWRGNPTAGVTPEVIMARLAEAIDAVDSQIEEPIVPVEGDALGDRFLAWNVGLGIDPMFSNCREIYSQEDSFSTFSCDVTMGDGYFFSVVAGENLPTSVTATVQMDGRLTVGEWPAPDGLVQMERDFREWIRAEYPELEDRMFGNDYAGVVRFSGEAGELHSQHLAEYLEYLTG